MSPLKNNRNKRYAELQFPSSSLLGSDHLHIAKKPKSANGMIPTTSSVSRLNLYPKKVSPIYREIKAPILAFKGFTANPSNLDTSLSHNLNADRMGSLYLNYYRMREEAIRGCQLLQVEKDDEIVEDVNKDNDGEGDSGVKEVEKEDFNKSVEIKAKNKELDGKAEGNSRFQPSTSSGVVSNLVDEKAIESLSLNRVDVDDGVPLYRKLINESARKNAERLRKLNFDNKLVGEKKTSFDKLCPWKKVEFIHSRELFKVEKDDEVVEDVDKDNDGEGDLGVKEVEKENFNKSVEIKAKNKELDGKAEGNSRFQPSTSSSVVSNLVDRKALEASSLNRVDVDDGVPLYRKLINESARKNAERLRKLNFDIKLVGEKKTLFDKFVGKKAVSRLSNNHNPKIDKHSKEI